jgi:hypothetical protein
MMVVAIAVIASGCSKKQGTSTTSPAPTATVQPSPGAPAASMGAGGTTGGGGTATASPSTGTGNADKKDVPPPSITKEQVDQISMTSTYDDLVKLSGSKGKLIKDESGKKTYEFAISNQAGYYVSVTYFADGKLSEKKVYKK